MVQKAQDEYKGSRSLQRISLRKEGIDNVVITRQEIKENKYFFTSKI
jgi:hypothetical protein